MRKIFVIAILGILASCSSNSSSNLIREDAATPAIDEQAMLKLGDSIATHAQQILLANVSSAIKEHGFAGAVSFCNENAITLTDSVSILHASQISRVSDKARNQNNELLNEMDKQAWAQIAAMMSDENAANKHLIMREQNEVFYFKAIPLGMPTCLACHGVKGQDIAAETQKEINIRYPLDKATGYTMGQLRGLWKIKLNTEL
ncbi:MAG: DUF3365 domain-containing protein [Bacteroidia bacterium]|nr:DUF3365 domain-containing protein [Bacteroidia bacterium]